MEYHNPVLLGESVAGLKINPNGTYVDLTFGGGGHSKEILKNLKKGKLFAFDQDEDAVKNVIDNKRFHFIRTNFRFFYNFLRYENIDSVDGILADLGVSSHHFDAEDRGFSFRHAGELDMRMDQNAKIDAKHILNKYDEYELTKIFNVYGELNNARKVSKLIINYRNQEKLKTIDQLKQALSECYKPHTEHKFLAKVFQAIRIEVNGEMKVLKDMLNQTLLALKPGGRLVIISYHSLEDRLVKNFMKSGNFEGKIEQDLYGKTNSPFEIISRKVIVPGDEEIEINPRARSAKLRIAEKF
jgi:16S rRNA (cytosine1402-N4)-methyltransferase